ncbi:DNA-directed RNA polymerase III subunit RPC4 [Morus notabilis]|nr:DNA-directed RNA polymerase III subunit RPC4 [Morus notabilis]
MPLVKRSASAKGKEKVGSSLSLDGPSAKGSKFEDLAAGFAGKMLVYKSGAVKLRLGDILYDVSAGSNCIFAEDVVTINTAEKQCCVLGALRKRAVVNPDINCLVNSVIDLG